MTTTTSTTTTTTTTTPFIPVHIPRDELPDQDMATYIPKKYSDPVLEVAAADGIEIPRH